MINRFLWNIETIWKLLWFRSMCELVFVLLEICLTFQAPTLMFFNIYLYFWIFKSRILQLPMNAWIAIQIFIGRLLWSWLERNIFAMSEWNSLVQAIRFCPNKNWLMIISNREVSQMQRTCKGYLWLHGYRFVGSAKILALIFPQGGLWLWLWGIAPHRPHPFPTQILLLDRYQTLSHM